MAAYTGIQGQNILIVSSDPANPTEGQIWYNSTSNLLKGQKYVEAWSSGGNLNTARADLSGTGTQTAALAYAGGPAGNTTESYNGSSWTSLGSLNANHTQFGMGIGTQTSALIAGGYNGTAVIGSTELWNGSSWTSNPNSLNTARYGGAGAGIQTAAILAGGNTAASTSTPSDASESWNGTSWTNTPSLNTSRWNTEGQGTQTASIAVGGYTGGPAAVRSTIAELWNGSSWTTSPANMNTGRGEFNLFGSQTAAIASGGNGATAFLAATESWNGSSWTTLSATLPTAIGAQSGAGVQTSGLSFGGRTPPNADTSATNEWNAAPTTQTITTS